MSNDDLPQEGDGPPTRLISVLGAICMGVVAAVATIAFFGWRDFYRNFLEPNPPEIIAEVIPRGIGIVPVSFRIRCIDDQSGLDEVVVRIRQRSMVKEIARQPAKGAREVELGRELSGSDLSLQEGEATLEIKAFDRSFWNNSAELSYQLKVDYRKPKLELISTQHNAVEGGSQLIVYRAIDENLALSGVKIGNRTFLGYRASGVDEEFTDRDLYVAVYAIEAGQQVDPATSRLFAEDEVGNGSSISFPNRVSQRSYRSTKIPLTDSFLRNQVGGLVSKNQSKLNNILGRQGRLMSELGEPGSSEQLVNQFKLIEEELKPLNTNELVSAIKIERLQRYWDEALSRQIGTIVGAFGDEVTFTNDGEPVLTAKRTGYEITLPANNPEVYATATGIVALSQNIGVYGSTVAVDHGLGVVSVYGYLDHSLVSKGEKVERGQAIAVAGNTGLSLSPRLLFEIRVHGIPVDAREWWDPGWFFGHITGKLDDAKRALGVTGAPLGMP